MIEAIENIILYFDFHAVTLVKKLSKPELEEIARQLLNNLGQNGNTVLESHGFRASIYKDGNDKIMRLEFIAASSEAVING